MGKFSFEVKDHRGYFEKLDAEYEDLEEDPHSSRHAINFATTAFHLCEWTWAHEPQVNTAYPSWQAFYEVAKRMCPEIQIMHDLAIGSKHVHITRGAPPKVQGTELHQGVFSKEFSLEFDVTMLLVNMADGSKHALIRDARTVIEFWRDLFQNGFHLSPR